MKIEQVSLAVTDEVLGAMARYPAMNSYHEGYAVILEELDELWDQVKKSPKNRNPEEIRKEAVQVAAMAVRFLADLC